MANFQAQPPAGRQLPGNWRAIASTNAAQADADYQHRISNAWRGNRDNETLIQSARLSNHPQPAPPRRIDSRSDARFDGTMLLVKDDDLEQIWKDNTGRLVTIKKRK
jgi:hypothetical protein